MSLSKRLSSEKAVLAAIRRRLGHVPAREDVDHLRRMRRLRNAMDETDPEEAIEALVTEIESLKASRRDRQARESTARPQEIPADARAHALAQILATEAGRLPEVKRFRESVQGLPLTPDRIEGWIEGQVKQQGRPTVYVRVPCNAQGEPIRGRRPAGLPEAVRLDYLIPGEKGSANEGWFKEVPTGEDSFKRVPAREGEEGAQQWIAAPGTWKHIVAVKAGGTLDKLKALAGLLTQRYGWSEARAVVFVLTDLAPPPSLASVTLRQGPTPASARIVLDVSPRLSPLRVLKLYREARSGEMFGQLGRMFAATERGRELTVKHAELTVSVAEKNDGRTWEAAMEEWNAEQSGHRYSEARIFARDGRAAYQRVTGERLDWKRRPGQREAATS